MSPLLSGCTLLHAAAAGGELLARLSDEGALRDDDARWCTACVVAALASLHAQGTVYRVRPMFCCCRETVHADGSTNFVVAVPTNEVGESQPV